MYTFVVLRCILIDLKIIIWQIYINYIPIHRERGRTASMIFKDRPYGLHG